MKSVICCLYITPELIAYVPPDFLNIISTKGAGSAFSGFFCSSITTRPNGASVVNYGNDDVAALRSSESRKYQK